jgi:hypothetical protein
MTRRNSVKNEPSTTVRAIRLRPRKLNCSVVDAGVVCGTLVAAAMVSPYVVCRSSSRRCGQGLRVLTTIQFIRVMSQHYTIRTIEIVIHLKAGNGLKPVV